MSKTAVQVEMDSTWENFLQTKVNSLVKWDLVRFFHDNNHTADTAENIARYMGRDAKSIERDLIGLVKSGVLRLEKVSGLNIYRLTDDTQTRDQINDFVSACYNREFRAKAIQHVIHVNDSTQHDI